jgi:hypothetical protein
MTDSPSMDAIAAMSPAEAGAALAAMDTAPTPGLVPQDSQDAKQQLDLLSRDPNWAQALFSGNAAVNDQFKKLNEIVAAADTVGDALAGIDEPQQIFETTSFGELPSSAVRAFIADRRLLGISDAAIKESLDQTPISAREHALTVAREAMRHSDKEWVSRYLRGELAERREQVLMDDLKERPIAAPE